MPSPRILPTLFCQKLLHTTAPPLFAHLTLHIPIRTIAGTYRVNSDGKHSTMSFCTSWQRCLGYALEESDKEPFIGPRLFSWLALGEYQAHNPEPIPESVSWSVLLGLFTTVDVITGVTLQTSPGGELAAAAPYVTLYNIFD